MAPPASSNSNQTPLRWPPLLVGLVLACVLPELVLQGADHGLWGSARWRPMAYAYGAFWAGLLRGWTPNFPGQSVTMFVTHGFLHGGALHLTFNMLTLLSLGLAIIARAGKWRFLWIYAASLLGGGVGFAMLTRTPQPMVGASGALFGLVGAWIVWGALESWKKNTGFTDRLWTIGQDLLWPVAILILLNLAMLWISGSQIAWETHLGGFVAGFATASFLPHPRRDQQQGGRGPE